MHGVPVAIARYSPFATVPIGHMINQALWGLPRKKRKKHGSVPVSKQEIRPTATDRITAYKPFVALSFIGKNVTLFEHFSGLPFEYVLIESFWSSSFRAKVLS